MKKLLGFGIFFPFPRVAEGEGRERVHASKIQPSPYPLPSKGRGKKLANPSKLIIALFILFNFITPASAETQPVTALSPDAEKYIEKGVAAAEQQDYELAIRYFNDALEEAPLYAPVYFNLALANDKAGHELVAIAWFKAYLQADPKSPKRKEIEGSITNLEVAVEGRAGKIFDQAIQTANALPDEQGSFGPRKDAFRNIFMAYAESGDVPTAVKFASQNEFWHAEDVKAEAEKLFASSLVREGDVDQALKIAKGLPADMKQDVMEQSMMRYDLNDQVDKAYQLYKMLPKPEESYALLGLAEAYARKDLWNEAIVTLKKQNKDESKFNSWISFSRIAARSGKPEKAKEFLAEARKISDGTSEQIESLASVFLELKDSQSAKQILESYKITGSEYGSLLGALAGHFEEVGESAKADELFSRLDKDRDRAYGAAQIIKGAAKRGDWRRGQKFISYLGYHDKDFPFSPFEIGSSYGAMAWVMIKEGKESEAKKLMKELPYSEKPDHKYEMYRTLTRLAAESGEDKRAFEYLEQLPSERWKDYGVAAIVEAKIKKKNYEDAMKILTDNLVLKFYSAGSSLFDYWFRIVDELNQSGKKQDAIRILDQAANAALKRRDLQALGNTANYYNRFGDREHEKQVRGWIQDFGWVVLAKEFENARTYNPQETYAGIQKKEGKEIPGALADLAKEYLLGIEKIKTLEK